MQALMREILGVGNPLEEACVLQVIALSCRRLRLLELPHNMPTSVVPVQANGHLCGLRIEGGVQTHRKGLCRRRHDRSTETFAS